MKGSFNNRSLFFFYMTLSVLFHIATTTAFEFSPVWLDQFIDYASLFLLFSFKPIEVFFHEASHALVSIAVANPFEALILTWHGNGSTILNQASPLKMAIISIAGYIGASLWGYLIYASSLKERKYSRFTLLAFCIAFVFRCADLTTLLVLCVIITVFLFSWLSGTIGAQLLKFIGVFIMVSALYSPTYLLSYASQGDHVAMQQYTGIPAGFWIAIWILFGAYILFIAFRLSTQTQLDDGGENPDYYPV